MKKIRMCASALLIAAAMLVSLCACGSSAPAPQPGSPAGVTDGVLPAYSEATGSGFTFNHAAAAGFSLGSGTPDDVIARFGQPVTQDYQEYTSVTVATLNYDFGVFEFEGVPGGAPVLTYVRIISTQTAPCGLFIGQNIEQAADTVYTGSGAGLTGTADSDIWFYGTDESGESYGRFSLLDIEYISSSSDDIYSLEYRAAAPEAGRMVTFTMYFDSDFNMTNFTLRYI